MKEGRRGVKKSSSKLGRVEVFLFGIGGFTLTAEKYLVVTKLSISYQLGVSGFKFLLGLILHESNRSFEPTCKTEHIKSSSYTLRGLFASTGW